MRTSVTLLILAAMAIGSSAIAMEATGTYAEAKTMAIENSKPLLVDFFTSW
jgi:hypothetical protein